VRAGENFVAARIPLKPKPEMRRGFLPEALFSSLVAVVLALA